MKTVVYLILRSFVATFYQAHAGFFLLLIIFAFGILTPTEHYFILLSALHSPIVTGGILLTWMIYVGMVIKFNMRLIGSSNYRFLVVAVVFPTCRQVRYALLVFVGQLLPVILYVCLLLGFGIYHQTWWLISVLLTFMGASFLFYVGIFYLKLIHPVSVPALCYWKTTVLHRQRFLCSFFWMHAFKKHFMLLFTTKLLSLGLLQIVMTMYTVDIYDSRLLFTGMLFSVLLHAGILYEFFEFAFHEVNFVRGLPLSLYYHYGTALLSFVILFLPEHLSLSKGIHEMELSWAILPKIWLLTIGLMMGMYAELLRKPIALRQLLRKYFFYFLFLFLCIMYGVPVVGIALLCLLISIPLFRKYFFLYE